MTFLSREYSLADGQPIRLYVFTYGDKTWRYCSADRDVQYSGETYLTLSGGIGDAGIIISGDPNADTIEITTPPDLPVTGLFRAFPPAESVNVQMFDAHYEDTQAILVWSGRITAVKWVDLDKCRISCVNFRADLNVPGLTDSYSRFCTAALGDSRCKVSLAALGVYAPVSTVSGGQVSAPQLSSQPSGYFASGHVAWYTADGVINRRHIETHSGDTAILLGGSQGIPASGLTFYPGCDFLPETCQNKFNNIANFRGIPQLQGESPFDGNQVF